MSTIQRDSIISFPFLGISFNPPSSFKLFGMDIYFYGVIIACAFLLGIIYATKHAKYVGLEEDNIYDAVLWMIPMSIIGARIYFVLFQLDYFLAYPSQLFAIREGGLAIYGGVIAGIITVWAVCKKEKIAPLAMIDVLIIACILGQAIGRWGNFMNREAFGAETDIFCKMGLTSPSGKTVYVHPTFLYESLWNFAGFLFLNHFLKSGRRKYNGQCLLIYCLWYGLGRFWIEGLRTDSLYLGSIRISQLLSLVLVIFGGCALLKNRERKDLEKTGEDPEPEEDKEETEEDSEDGKEEKEEAEIKQDEQTEDPEKEEKQPEKKTGKKKNKKAKEHEKEENNNG